jgi:hypothetical protein
MVLGMAPPPVVVKPQPKPQLKIEEHPTPEFMWCQRSDRVYVTIKVADCKGLTFGGEGHGMCGQREYALDVQLAGALVPEECCWFVSGPNVRLRLQKAKVGPYWGGLLAGKRKMAQLKVDWSSWLDEDEENERSAAPNGFDAEKMKTIMVASDKDEAQNSILIDEGMNTVDDIQVKFKALEYEKEQTAKTKQARYELRKATREAQLFSKKRETDLKYGRAPRELTEEEVRLLEGAPTLYDRLKEERKAEKAFWLGKWWHQRRPEKRKIDLAEPLAREAAVEAVRVELEALRAKGGDIGEARTRRGVERRIFLKVGLEGMGWS